MPVDALPLGSILAPIAFVIATVYLIGPTLPLHRPVGRWIVFGFVWAVVARYMAWRFFDTVLPARGVWYELTWIWFCFAVELLALADALLLYIGFLRVTDRRGEADRHEAALRALPPEILPSVDVYIPTYNEPLDVVEKTIIGALSLDYPNAKVWMLDDGRRAWLKEFCVAKGAGYITRPDNAHAKAGNINHALAQTSGEFVAIFDADFVPCRNFLMRAMGFFADPKIGIVQVPHAFYNNDPMQVNLSLRKTLPDDQRFFFEAIMPSRDGWDAAFCCGSNSVTRRAALRTVGDALPLGSITEDMLLSLALLRQGYVTRYLSEHLAFGLAPESLRAFFVQRQRWARGAIQMMYLPEGPFGRGGLRLVHRLLFLPTHWLTQSLMLMMSLIVPIVFMWTDLRPLVNVTAEAALYYIVPMVLAITGGITVYAPRFYFPLAAQVLNTFQSFKVLPIALQTLLRPKGHVFKITPKGSDAGASGYDRAIFWSSIGFIVLTFGGLLVNALPNWRVVSQSALLPMVFTWSLINLTVLFLVSMMSLQTPVRRSEERFSLDEPIALEGAAGAVTRGRIRDLSLSGVGISVEEGAAECLAQGEEVRLSIREVGVIGGTVARRRGDFVGVRFALEPSLQRDLLIRKLFTSGFNTSTVAASFWSATLGLLKSIWSARSTIAAAPAAAPPRDAEEKLPARSFVLPPPMGAARLADLAPTAADLAA